MYWNVFQYRNQSYVVCIIPTIFGKTICLNLLKYSQKGGTQLSSFDSITIYHDTDSVYHGWQKLPPHLLALTVQEFQEVMDDGLANGFEFRLQGSTILYREVQP